MSLLLVRQEILRGQGKSLDELNVILDAERQQPEGARMELALHLGFRDSSAAARLLAEVIEPANRACQQTGVTPWPEQRDVVSLTGNVVRIRWRKGSLWWVIVWDIIKPLLIILLIAGIIYLLFWVLSRYVTKDPVAAAGLLGLILALSAPVWLPPLTRLVRGRSQNYA